MTFNGTVRITINEKCRSYLIVICLERWQPYFSEQMRFDARLGTGVWWVFRWITWCACDCLHEISSLCVLEENKFSLKITISQINLWIIRISVSLLDASNFSVYFKNKLSIPNVHLKLVFRSARACSVVMLILNALFCSGNHAYTYKYTCPHNNR